jgi:NhaC family Na+:H+ antiporter
VQEIMRALEAAFAVRWYLLIPVVVVLTLVVRKVPALPALLIGALLGCLFAVLFQQATVLSFVGESSFSRPVTLLKGAWMSLFDGFRISSGNEALDNLLTRGGMSSMLSTVWLILSAMAFGAVMETTGMLQRIAKTILGAVRGSGSLIAATLGTSFAMNVLASDQYIAIVLPGRMFREEYARRGLHPKNLSRSLEDAGTLTSPLVPWNTCGAFMAQTLGVATFAYAPFAFFNLINPIVAAGYGFTGFTIAKAEPEEPEAALR